MTSYPGQQVQVLMRQSTRPFPLCPTTTSSPDRQCSSNCIVLHAVIAQWPRLAPSSRCLLSLLSPAIQQHHSQCCQQGVPVGKQHKLHCSCCGVDERHVIAMNIGCLSFDPFLDTLATYGPIKAPSQPEPPVPSSTAGHFSHCLTCQDPLAQPALQNV